MVGNATKDSSLEKLKYAWKKVLLTECIAIAVINVFTVVVFVRNWHLRKRITYLIINLTVADLLVGAVSGPLEIFGPDLDRENGFRWRDIIILTSGFIFSPGLSSQSFVNLFRTVARFTFLLKALFDRKMALL